MTTESSIRTSNIPWQIRQLGKNVSEWIQLQLSRDTEPEAPPPNYEFPAWIGQLLFWGLVVGAIAWFAWLIVQAIDQYLENRRRRVKPSLQVETVKPVVDRSVAGWLRQAQEFEREGNWREACRALYMAALQLLHDREWIPHQVSRTDGEYLQAIQALTQPRPLQVLIRTHERSLFGGEPLGADNLQRCRQAYEEIEKR
jgi:hypothetical protein